MQVGQAYLCHRVPGVEGAGGTGLAAGLARG